MNPPRQPINRNVNLLKTPVRLEGKTTSKFSRLSRTKLPSFLIFVALLVSGPLARAADAPKTARPNIYDESLDGRKQIREAMAKAAKENKRVLLQFGANWCGWCHKLHTLCADNKVIHDKLASDYVVALIDVNKGHNEDLVTKYEAKQIGLPFIVILDAEGTHLTTKNTGELEEGDHHSPEKVLDFLKKWSPKK